MPGIYIHVPFCKQKCHYCNFYSVASFKYRDAFIPALLREIKLRNNYLSGKNINTVYFGGGTPSLLKTEEINTILNALNSTFNINNNAEITLEANPDDLSEDYLRQLRQETPVNRLSIGVQSFFDDDLEYLNRVHSGKEAQYAVECAQAAGFSNITIDLIYGIPTLTVEKWRKNLELFFAFDLPHLSSYALTVEPRTSLDVLIKKGKLAGVKEEPAVDHFNILLNETAARGYVHYEISNFAKKGCYSKHNSIYWLGGHYLGLGPSAHSFNGTSRQWNVSNLKQYTGADMVEKIVEEKELLSEKDRYNEYVMTSLRTTWGCDAEHIKNIFGETVKNRFETGIQPFIDRGEVINKNGTYILSGKGKLFADGIAAALFWD